MKIDETIFRRYDIRGVYPAEFNEEAAYKIGLAFSNLFPEMKRVVIGGDARETTPQLKEAVIKGLIDGGKEVIDIGIVVTPIVFFSVCHYGFDGGVAITGSHLGGEYNGIKLVLKDAHPTLPDDYENLKRLIMNDELKKVNNPKAGVEKKDVEKDYIKKLLESISLKKPLKIVADCGNGTARDLPEKIFRKLGCDVETIFMEADDNYPNHIADPYKKENMQDLKRKVLEVGADLGIGYDGDGDRAGFIDEKGNMISGDDLLMIFTKDAFKRKKGPVVADARVSMALLDEVKKEGQEVSLTVSYHGAVLDKILEKDAVFGGETTSHFYFPLDSYLTDDAIFASLKMAQIVSEIDDFPAYVEDLPRYATGEEIFIEFPDTEKYQAVEKFTEMVKEKGHDVNDVDGSRINFDNGWGIVRPSNTSPFIKVKFEGKTEEDLIDVSKKMLALMEEAGIVMSDEDKKKIGVL